MELFDVDGDGQLDAAEFADLFHMQMEDEEEDDEEDKEKE